jgi:hypothetical protein
VFFYESNEGRENRIERSRLKGVLGGPSATTSWGSITFL